jgi:hypothetical protein
VERSSRPDACSRVLVTEVAVAAPVFFPSCESSLWMCMNLCSLISYYFTFL